MRTQNGKICCFLRRSSFHRKWVRKSLLPQTTVQIQQLVSFREISCFICNNTTFPMESTRPEIPTNPKIWTYNGVGLTRQGSPKCGYYFDLDVKTGNAVDYSCAVDSGTFWSPIKSVQDYWEESVRTHSIFTGTSKKIKVRRRTRLGAWLLLLFACRTFHRLPEIRYKTEQG